MGGDRWGEEAGKGAMAFASDEGAIVHLAEAARALSETWQDQSGCGAGVWGAEVGCIRIGEILCFFM